MKLADNRPLSRAEFHERLRRIGAERYHDRHPFHARLHGGECSPDEVRAWVVNRWQYQSRIPMKDAAFMPGSRTRSCAASGGPGSRITTAAWMRGAASAAGWPWPARWGWTPTMSPAAWA